MKKSKPSQGKKSKGHRSRPQVVTRFGQFPNSMDVAIRYSTRIQYSSSAFSVYNVNMSSLQTFQGFYRDQLLALFKNYVVLGFTVNYKIVNTDFAGNQGEIILFDCPSSETAGLTFANILEWPGSKKQILSYYGNKMVLTHTRHYSLPQIYKKDISVDSDFWGTAASAPGISDPQEHCLALYSLNGSATVQCMVDREYVFHTRFFRRENPGNSLTVSDLKPVFPEKKKPKKAAVKLVVSESD